MREKAKRENSNRARADSVERGASEEECQKRIICLRRYHAYEGGGLTIWDGEDDREEFIYPASCTCK